MTYSFRPGFSLESAPEGTQKDLPLWVDFAELVCEADADGEATAEAVWDRTRNTSLPAPSDEGDEELDIEVSSRGRSDEQQEKTRVRILQLWPSILQHVRMRGRLCAGSYPYTVNGDTLTYLPSVGNARPGRLYRFLLASANSFRMLEASDRRQARQDFELIAFYTARRMYPRFECGPYGVGAPSHLQPFAPANSSFLELVRGIKLNLKTKVVATVSSLKARANGDGGMDTLAWYNMNNDPECPPMCIIGQAACSWNDFVKKQTEASFHARWHNMLRFKPASSGMLFVPHFVRGVDGRWFEHKATEMLQDVAWIDRPRILNVLAGEAGTPQWGALVDAWFVETPAEPESVAVPSTAVPA